MNTKETPKNTRNHVLPQDAVDRVWEHALHEEKMHSDRSNFFLVAEAMLFVFYATLDAGTQVWALVTICLLGIALTIMWILIALRQKWDLEVALERLEDYVQEYAVYKEQVGEGWLRVNGTTILGYWVPSMIGVTWAVLVIEILTR